MLKNVENKTVCWKIGKIISMLKSIENKTVCLKIGKIKEYAEKYYRNKNNEQYEFRIGKISAWYEIEFFLRYKKKRSEKSFLVTFLISNIY